MVLAVVDITIGVIASGIARVVHYGGMAVRRTARAPGEPPLIHPRAPALRHEACDKGATLADVNDAALSRVLRHCGGDVALAADALAMSPPPTWIERLISPW